MKWLVQGYQRSRVFLWEVQNELRKSMWPTRSELVESTAVVIFTVVLVSAAVGLSDTILSGIVRVLFQ